MNKHDCNFQVYNEKLYTKYLVLVKFMFALNNIFLSLLHFSLFFPPKCNLFHYIRHAYNKDNQITNMDTLIKLINNDINKKH